MEQPAAKRMPNPAVLRALARAFLSGDQSVEQVIARGRQTLGRNWRWLGPLVRRYFQTLADGTRPRHRDVVRFLRHDQPFANACLKYGDKVRVEQWLIEPQQMQPVAKVSGWGLPPITTAGELADWLWLDTNELEWFADLKDLSRKGHSRLAHYHYRVLAKGGGSIRLIEAPKPRLKKLQRQILEEILDKIPCHPAAHGFVKGRSIKTFAAPHVGQRVVLKMDLQDFFPSLVATRVQAFFRTLGYPESVANALAGICTNCVPTSLWNSPGIEADNDAKRTARDLYCRPHLPQGAPTSPSIANLLAYRAECRLTGLAQAVGAEFTRYADDLAFSGGAEFETCVERFASHAAAILAEEGFTVHHRKTRIMRQGVRQYLAGLVANRRMNVPRSDFDRLKAILNNCVRFGPDSQNREANANFRAHLNGRLAFVESINPEKGKRLRIIFQEIQWP